MPLLIVLSRWLHIMAACLAIGGVFFMRFILPCATRLLESEQQKQVLLRARRLFKRVVHSSILVLILSGIYNTYLAWDKYTLDPAVLHPLWGTHVLLGLIVFAIALYVLAGAEPPASHRTLMAVNFAILLLAMAAASTLKWAREKVVSEHAGRSWALDSR
jgi:uncharacterized membrane protein